MANLEVQIGADNSEFLKKISETEKEIQKLESQKAANVKLGVDTTTLNKSISDAKSKLDDLKKSMTSTGQSFANASKPVTNAGHTLTQFSRIAQDAPFGIIGIGNNLTATAEAFSSLSKQSGGAGNALKAVAGSLMGSGGILLAISLVTTGLTIMSQQGLTVGDVFDKLTGRFDNFKKELQEVNKEAAKTGQSEGAIMKGFASAAANVDLSMRDRLIAVKKLQDEYPAYFGNLSKEQILNGNVAGAINQATNALIAKAKAQGFANKIGELAEKEVPLRDKELKLIKQYNAELINIKNARERIAKEGSTDRTRQQLAATISNARRYREELDGIQTEIRGIISETNKWQKEVNKNIAISVPTEFDPPKDKEVKQLQTQVSELAKGLKPIGLGSLIKVDSGIFTSDAGIGKDMDRFIKSLTAQAKPMSDALFNFWMGIKSIQDSLISNVFGGVGDAIGQALASGANVLQAVGASLVSSLGSLLSSIGDKLIALGAASVLAGTVLATFGTPVGIAAGIAAIAAGTVLKIGGGALSGVSKNMTSGGGGNKGISAGNSVSNPTSSVSNSGSFSGGGTVVFEISGQSLVGVLSNTLNKNIKIGGAMPAI